MTTTTDDRDLPDVATTADRDEDARIAVLERYGLLEGSAPSDGDQERDIALSRLARLAALVCGTSASVVNIITADAQRQVAAWGIDPDVCARSDSMCAVVFASGGPTAVTDARTDPRFADSPWVTGPLGRIRLYASAPLVTADGVPLGSLCVFDVTARELTDEQVTALETLAHQVVDVLDLQLRTRELRARTEELVRSNQLLGEFSGRVAHDLRAPLAAISGFAELAHEELTGAGDDRTAGHVARIRRAAGRMHAMLTDLLSFASVGGTPDLAYVRLSELVDEVLEDLVGVVAGSGAEVVVRDAVVRADRGQLRALLQNTIANAIAYRDRDRPDAPPCRVEVVGEELAVGWRLRVVDHGPGIPARDRARVLEPFVRGATGGVPGTGLGLATVARIAAAHGGSLALEDTPGGGTTVTVTVPAG